MKATYRFNGEVPLAHSGETVVLFATGPGLTKEVVDEVRPYHRSGRVRAFGINDAYRIVPYLDHLYACDPRWWDLHVKKGWVMDYLCDSMWTQDKATAKQYKLSWVAGAGEGDGVGLYDKARDRIFYGGNSGYQAINVALHMGFERMILCGYNMTIGHFFGEHEGIPNTNLGTFIPRFLNIQRQYRDRIVNCTPNTKLTAFEKRNLSDVLRELG